MIGFLEVYRDSIIFRSVATGYIFIFFGCIISGSVLVTTQYKTYGYEVLTFAAVILILFLLAVIIFKIEECCYKNESC
jgi:hypothetical protein